MLESSVLVGSRFVCLLFSRDSFGKRILDYLFLLACGAPEPGSETRRHRFLEFVNLITGPLLQVMNSKFSFNCLEFLNFRFPLDTCLFQL